MPQSRGSILVVDDDAPHGTTSERDPQLAAGQPVGQRHEHDRRLPGLLAHAPAAKFDRLRNVDSPAILVVLVWEKDP